MTSENDPWNRFVEGVQLVFGHWTALQLAVENGWGGRESAAKAEEFMEDILYWFTLCNNDPDVYALQDQLFAALLEDFNTEVEDGSLTEVAENLVALYQQCWRGDETLLQSLRTRAASIPAEKASVTDQMEDGESEVEMPDQAGDSPEMQISLEAVQKRGPERDSDGFTVVNTRRRRQ